MKTGDSKITFQWNLSSLEPRVDIKLSNEDDLKYLNKYFPFKYRRKGIDVINRHYRVPIWFHLPFVRWYYSSKIKKCINQNW